jgi:hypothetical protein
MFGAPGWYCCAFIFNENAADRLPPYRARCYVSVRCKSSGWRKIAIALTDPDFGEQTGRVENRRSGVSLPVAPDAAFARVASVRLGLALFPVPAHRTEQARFTHSALGESVTRSPTESWSSAY